MTYTKEQQKANRQKWVAALREPGRKQVIGMLENPDGQCCLGVACEVSYRELELDKRFIGGGDHAVAYNGYWIYMPPVVRNWLGLTDTNGQFVTADGPEFLAALNDMGTPFSKIADIIESEPEGLLA